MRLKINIKHIITLLLVLGLAINDCSLYSPSNTIAYHQSYHVDQKLSSHNNTVHFFSGKQQSHKGDRFPFHTISKQLTVVNPHTIQVTILLQNQTFIYQKKRAAIAHYTFVNKAVTSKEIV